MFGNKRVLALIPARGGSKGVPGKNIRALAGKPLLAWTVAAAQGSRYIDRIVLSSDDEAILEVGRCCGAETPFVRPAHLSGDQARGVDVVVHAIEAVPGYDYVVLLQPTSPLRAVEDIDGAIELMMQRTAPACVSVTRADKSPYWMYFVDQAGGMAPVLKREQRAVNRQELPDVYVLNGAVYVAEISWFLQHRSFLTEQTVAYPMPQARSVDIDTERDFAVTEWILSTRDSSGTF
jgi:N-acylneuraminate cytidylyltransferase